MVCRLDSILMQPLPTVREERTGTKQEEVENSFTLAGMPELLGNVLQRNVAILLAELV